MRLILLLAVVASLGACTTFDPIVAGVCGNGIIEPGEDCDSTDATCVACAISCATDACPANYACGVDRTCHAPGGKLAAPTDPQSFPVDDFRLSDIDKDGRQDVLGVSKTSISVRFGDATGKLERSTSFITPTQSGTPSFGDLDGDGATDVTISTVDGLVAFASTYKVLSPLTTTSQLATSNNTIEMLFPINATVTGTFFFDPMGHLQLGVGNLQDPPTVAATLPCNNTIDNTDFSADLVDIYQIPRATTAVTSDDLVITLTTKKQPARPCVMSVHVETTPVIAVKITSQTPTGIGTDNTKLVLADITDDGDPCPSVIDTHSTPGTTGTNGPIRNFRAWTGKYVPATIDPIQARCSFLGLFTTLPMPSTVPAIATAVGRVPIFPRVPGGPEGLMLTSGIYVVLSINNITNVGTVYEAYHSFRDLGAVAVGDLDGDGKLDAVASSIGEDDLDVMFRHDVYPNLATFQLYRLDTANEISRITVGDFDGDQISDIAYTERVIGHERMLISYGTFDRPGVPVEVATFDELLSVIPANFPDSSDELLVITDLVVIERQPKITEPVATILHGSPQRTMLSFYTPVLYDQSQESFRGSIIGKFSPDDIEDVIAITETHAWMVAGTGTGFDASKATQRTDLAMIAHCKNGAGAANEFCTNDATYLAWPTSTGDVIFGMDRQTSPHGILVVPPAGGTMSVAGTPVDTMTAMVPPGATVRALYAIDIDGDGAKELVETFGPPLTATSASGPGVVLICPVSSTSVHACADVRTAINAIDSSITTCIDATVGSFTLHDPAAPAKGNELAVLCYDAAGNSSIFAIEPDQTAVLVQHDVGQLRGIRAGDVTGDGVPDLIGIAGGDDGQSLVVFPQCGSRDLACLSKVGL